MSNTQRPSSPSVLQTTGSPIKTLVSVYCGNEIWQELGDSVTSAMTSRMDISGEESGASKQRSFSRGFELRNVQSPQKRRILSPSTVGSPSSSSGGGRIPRALTLQRGKRLTTVLFFHLCRFNTFIDTLPCTFLFSFLFLVFLIFLSFDIFILYDSHLVTM